MFVLDGLFLAITMPFLLRIRQKPEAKGNMDIYMRLLCVWYLRVTMQAFPPFGKTCDRRRIVFEHFQECLNDGIVTEQKMLGVVSAMRNMNCTPMGHSQVQLLMTWILLSPVFMPTTQMMWYNVLFVISIQFPAIIAYRRMVGELYYLKRDMTATLCLLCFVSGVAFGRKFFMSRNEESLARSDREAKDVTQKLYSILSLMVPEHVISDMLTKPVVADPLDRVSILFIMIVGFDEHVQQRQPEELVEFLNGYFTAWDEICYQNRVTKIETVGEEYVCAVGVSPHDQRVNERIGHRVILNRLIRAAVEILSMHSEEVQLKMGMHTGPIVAGVLGLAKLPRFRLFGDTINTSARMMQKGIPGKLQFGEETMKHVNKNELPDSATVYQRGQVEMKGKGMVVTYLLEPGVRFPKHRPSTESAAGEKLRKSISALGAAPAPPEEEDSNAAKPKPIAARPGGPRRTDAPAARPRAPTADKDLPSAWHQALPEAKGGRGLANNAANASRMPASSNQAAQEAAALANQIVGIDDDLEEGLDGEQQGGSGLESTLAAVNSSQDRNYNYFVRVLSFGLRTGFFNDKREQEFRKWFHSEIVCYKLESRMHKQAVMLIALTSMEMLYYEFLKIFQGEQAAGSEYASHWLAEVLGHWLRETWGVNYLARGVLRLPLFMCCRFLSYFIIIGWQGLARQNNRSMLEQLPQFFLMSSYCFIAFLFFLSYDAITSVNNEDITDQATPDQLQQMMNDHTRNSSINSLIYFPVYVLIISQTKCRFQYSLMYVLLAALLMRLSKQHGWFNLFFSQSGRSYFIGVSMVYALFAWKEEYVHRRRFKSQVTVRESRQRIDSMLSKLMPPKVLEEIKAKGDSPNQQPPSHFYRHATIAQSDLVGFTALASTRTPEDVVSLISELFGSFDVCTDEFGVYKVETVGDAYIAGQADPPLTEENRPAQVARFGLAMIDATKRWSARHGLSVCCRVGLHTGSCTGGIVGTEMQRYHLFGDLMTVLEVLESTAPKSCVQASPGWMKAFQKSADLEDLEELNIKQREGDILTTSKGEEHSFDEVGGRTFVIYPPEDQ